jgi:type VI secretion system secreted protein VgrG
VKAPIVALIGAIGDFKGGGSNIKLGGGPVVIKGSKIAIETALLVKFGSSLTMGA